MTDDERYDALRQSLTNHTPSAKTIEFVRSTAWDFGRAIIETAPESRERSIALTHLEDATMWAVKALILAEVRA